VVSLKILVAPAAGLFACALFGNGGVHAQRASARTSVNSNIDRTTTVNRSTSVHPNTNNTVNRKIDVDRAVDVNVDRRDGGYYGCCYEPHPIATAATVTAAAVTTAAVIGTTVTSVPPACSIVVVGAMSYQHCGSTWYQPQFVGSSVSYVVVSQPR
jgi:hypothetical protein